MTQQDTSAAEQPSGLRWQIEQFHCEFQQVTGVECCQCRKGRSQRNHIAIAARVWLRLKHVARQAQTSVYQRKQRLLDEYMTREPAQPTTAFA